MKMEVKNIQHSLLGICWKSDRELGGAVGSPTPESLLDRGEDTLLL